MTRHRVLRSLSVLAVAALTFSACGDEGGETQTGTGQAGGDNRTYAIAFVGPLTGDNANLGINIRNGAKVAVQEANKAGGPKFRLEPFDTQGDPAQATTVKDRFVNDQSFLAVVGPTFSG